MDPPPADDPGFESDNSQLSVLSRSPSVPSPVSSRQSPPSQPPPDQPLPSIEVDMEAKVEPKRESRRISMRNTKASKAKDPQPPPIEPLTPAGAPANMDADMPDVSNNQTPAPSSRKSQPPVSENKCTACGQMGHKRNWKTCPMFESKAKNSKGKSASATPTPREDIPVPQAPASAAKSVAVDSKKDSAFAVPAARRRGPVTFEASANPERLGWKCNACEGMGHRVGDKICPMSEDNIKSAVAQTQSRSKSRDLSTPAPEAKIEVEPPAAQVAVPEEAQIERADSTPAEAAPSTPARGTRTSTPSSTSRKCGNCGQVGHLKTNKLCPMFNGTLPSIEADDDGASPLGDTPAPAAPELNSGSSVTGTPSRATSTPKRVLAKCGNCGQPGHMKTNSKMCPMLNGSRKSDSADPQAEVESSPSPDSRPSAPQAESPTPTQETTPSTGTKRKCARCGQQGHIKTNTKLCPMGDQYARPETRLNGIRETSDRPSAKWRCHGCKQVGHKSNDAKKCPKLNGALNEVQRPVDAPIPAGILELQAVAGIEEPALQGGQMNNANNERHGGIVPKKRTTSGADKDTPAKKQKLATPDTTASEKEASPAKDGPSNRPQPRFRFKSATPAVPSKEPTPAAPSKQTTPASEKQSTPAQNKGPIQDLDKPLAPRPTPKFTLTFKKPAAPVAEMAPILRSATDVRPQSSPLRRSKTKRIIYDSDDDEPHVEQPQKRLNLKASSPPKKIDRGSAKCLLQMIQANITQHPPVAEMIKKFKLDATKVHTMEEPKLLVHEHAEFATKIFEHGAAPKVWTVGSPGQEKHWDEYKGPDSPFDVTDVPYEEADLLLFTEMQHIHWMAHSTDQVKMVLIRDKNFQARRREMSRDKFLKDKEVEAKGKLDVSIDVHSYSTPLRYRNNMEAWKKHGGHGERIGVGEMLNLWHGPKTDQDGDIEMSGTSSEDEDEGSDFEEEVVPVSKRARKNRQARQASKSARQRSQSARQSSLVSDYSLFGTPPRKTTSKSPSPKKAPTPTKESRLKPRFTPANHLSLSWRNTERPGGLSKFTNTFQDALRYTNYATQPKCGGKALGDVGKTMIAADMKGCESWAIMAQAGAVSKFHIDANGVNTHVTLEGNTLGGVGENDEDVVKLWPAFPLWRLPIDEQEDAYQDFVKTIEHSDWIPTKLLKKVGKIPLIALFRHDTLIMPTGTIHCPITITDSLMLGGMVWNPKTILRTLSFYAWTAVYDITTNEDATPQARIIVPWLLNEIRNKQIDVSAEGGYPSKLMPKKLNDWMKIREKAILSRVAPCHCAKRRCQEGSCSCLLSGISCDPAYCHLTEEEYDEKLFEAPFDKVMRIFDWK